ncbi:MAG: ROK family protein [Mycobacteriales bacterium]
MGLAIGVDVGGTKVAAGVVDDDGQVLEQLRVPTPSNSPGQVAGAIESAVAELALRHPARAVGIGAAGFVDADRASVLFAPNLAWRNEPLRDQVAARTGLPVIVENDANAMAWGEYRFGAGRGVGVLVCLTVGTGIGGGLVIDGRLFRGAFGIGAEFGHLRVVPQGRPCGCGNHGCWEQYASGRALGPDGPAVTRAAAAGDPAALAAFAEAGRWLGQGMADLAAVLDPGRFVVGGGVIDAGELLLGPAREAFRATLTGRGHRPEAEIVAAQLGGSAGLVGAADLARTSR